jgi:hypothetical protein
MNYKELAKSLQEPLLEYIYKEHMDEVNELFTDYIEEFLMVKLGELNKEARVKLTKQLLERVI